MRQLSECTEKQASQIGFLILEGMLMGRFPPSDALMALEAVEKCVQINHAATLAEDLRAGLPPREIGRGNGSLTMTVPGEHPVRPKWLKHAATSATTGKKTNSEK